MSETAVVRDVAESAFDSDVLQGSHARPVVVDFWAPWCGPCRQLSPLLERVAALHAGEVDVVKVNVDEAPTVAARYGVRGIPAVKAFRNGAVAAEFVGVQPEPVVQRFFAGLLPSEADRLVMRAEEAPADERRTLLQSALQKHPSHARARQLLAELELAGSGIDDAEREHLRAAAAAGDTRARIRLGRALAAAGDYDAALGELIAAVADPGNRDEARAAVLEVFAVLGDGHPTVQHWRPKLASALF